MDPDNTSQLTAKLGVHNRAHILIQRHQANNPPELAAAQVKHRDAERTEALDYEELEHVAREIRATPRSRPRPARRSTGSPRARPPRRAP
jgi:hypothetical protein